MAACPGKTAELDDNDAEDPTSRNFGEVTPNELPLQRVHAVLDRMSASNATVTEEGNEDDDQKLFQHREKVSRRGILRGAGGTCFKVMFDYDSPSNRITLRARKALRIMCNNNFVC